MKRKNYVQIGGRQIDKEHTHTHRQTLINTYTHTLKLRFIFIFTLHYYTKKSKYGGEVFLVKLAYILLCAKINVRSC